MAKIISTLDGSTLPVHQCAPRSEIARVFATVFTQPSGGEWHHQLDVGPNAQLIAIRFCPFCGRDLQRSDFDG